MNEAKTKISKKNVEVDSLKKVSIFYAGDDFIERGRAEYKYLLDVYKKFFINNEAIVEEHLIMETL